MSSRDWLRYFAILGLTIAAVVVASLVVVIDAAPDGPRVVETGPPVESNGQRQSHDEYECREQFDPWLPCLSENGEPESTGRSEDRAYQYQRDDLVAQQAMAESASRLIGPTVVQTWIAGAGVLLILATTFLNWRATIAAQQSAEAARQTLEGLERPYLFKVGIKVKVSAGARISDNEQFTHLLADIGMRNVGRVPGIIRNGRLTFAIGDIERFDLAKTVFAREKDVLVIVGTESDDNTTVVVFEGKFHSHATDELLRDHSHGLRVMIIFGVILYEDVLGNQFERHFCTAQNGVDLGGSAYNYERKVGRELARKPTVWRRLRDAIRGQNAHGAPPLH